MDKNDWQKAKNITLDLIDLSDSERNEYLAGLDTSDEIKREIERLLKFESTAENWDLPPAIELSKESFSWGGPERPHLIGKHIGAYEITGDLGFGGMGAVYLGERTVGGSRQRVAIKLLKREMNTGVLRKRFRREQEILAALEHPNIARLIDFGATDDGVPYSVMEYAEGVRIDEFCTDNKLGLLARLKLFVKVCDAVAYAHRNLIIHRDIKPSNIIVSPDGEPKLLDFGISKLIDESRKGTDTVTQLGAMTPAYASPEQIDGRPVSTATDIYSLGVVLFKVLTGIVPFGSNETSNPEVMKEVVESQPALPSVVVHDAVPDRAILASELKGDLDNIVMKALRKEPERRYRTVDQFSEDIWRYIDGLPVTARPATLAYRASKFYKRNRIQVVAAGVVILSLIAGFAVAVRQTSIAREQARLASAAQQRAEAESARSREEEERAGKVTEFMEKIIAYANPGLYAAGSGSNGEAKVIDVLDAMSGSIESEFPGRPDIQSELHHKFAEVYTVRSGQGDAAAGERALYHANRAIDLRKEFYGDRHELVAKDMYYLWANRSRSNAEDKDGLARLLAAAIEMMRETDPGNVNLPHMLLDYSNRLWGRTDPESAEAYYKNALPMPDVERPALAESYLEDALAKFRAHYNEDHPAIVTASCSLGILQIEHGQFAKASVNFEFCRRLPQPQMLDLPRYSKLLEEGTRAVAVPN